MSSANSRDATKSWLIVGGGVSGFAAAQLLQHRQQRSVRLSEAKSLTTEEQRRWAAIGVEVCDGGHAREHLDDITDIVLSPGLPPDHNIVQEARRRGVPWISEIDLALQGFSGMLVGITGTNGKSTTVAMVGHILKKWGIDAEVCGNIGTPAAAVLARDRKPDWLILELSSYQLEQSQPLPLSAAALIDLSPDHLAYHKSMAAYREAKLKIFHGLRKPGLALIKSSIEPPEKISQLTAATALTIKQREEPGPSDIIVDGLQIHWASENWQLPPAIITPHDALNAAFAVALAKHVIDIADEEPAREQTIPRIIDGLSDFAALPFRCQKIGRIGEVEVVNDSKSTNLESTIAALELASSDRPSVLIMGGRTKEGAGERVGGSEDRFSAFAKYKSKIHHIIVFGEARDSLRRALSPFAQISHYNSLRSWVEGFPSSLTSVLPKSGVLLFSPGCASFDEFKNFEDRGQFFDESLSSLPGFTKR